MCYARCILLYYVLLQDVVYFGNCPYVAQHIWCYEGLNQEYTKKKRIIRCNKYIKHTTAQSYLAIYFVLFWWYRIECTRKIHMNEKELETVWFSACFKFLVDLFLCVWVLFPLIINEYFKTYGCIVLWSKARSVIGSTELKQSIWILDWTKKRQIDNECQKENGQNMRKLKLSKSKGKNIFRRLCYRLNFLSTQLFLVCFKRGKLISWFPFWIQYFFSELIENKNMKLFCPCRKKNDPVVNRSWLSTHFA